MKTISILVAIAASLTAVSAAPAPLPVAEPEAVELQARQYSGSTTQNQLTDGTACRAVTIIYARGTSEVGNVGAIAGPPFFQSLANSIGASNLAVQGVDYSASIAGFLAGGDAAGSRTFANLINQAASQCPNTKIVISGYSQGGQLVHNAAETISSSVASRISSAVIFGDPDNGDAVANVPSSKTLIICNATDNICQGGALVLPSHLTYGQDADRAAAFVKSQAGL